MSEALKRQLDAESISQYSLSRKVAKTRWLIAITAALALHGTIAIGTQATPENIRKAKQTISFLIQGIEHTISRTLNLFSQSPTEQEAKTEQVNAWRNALKENPNLPDFDYGDFFLKLSWLKGYISKEELEKDQQKLAELIKHYQELQKKPSEGLFSIIKKMIEEQFGEYTELSAQLHTILNEGKGSCDARIQMMISLIKGTFGGKIPMKVRISRQKLENGKEQLHVDLLIEIYGKWHIVEPGIPETGINDLEGTAIFDVSDYVKTYIKEDNQKPESNIVKPGKTPNKNRLDNAETDGLITLAGNIDPEQLKTHRQRPQDKREPIEMTVIPRDSQAPTVIPPTKDKPDTDAKPKKRQLTKQEVVDAALSKAIKISPDIESLEPLRGIPLDGIYITNTPDRTPNNPLTGKYPSFEPLAETPLKEIMLSGASHYKDSHGVRKTRSGTVPDLSPLYGRTVISNLLIATENLQEWEQILQNFTIHNTDIFITGDRNNQTTLKPLTNAKITKSLRVSVVVKGGTMDLTGIDSLAVNPPELRMTLFIIGDEKLLNPEALGRVHFTVFETSDYTLNSGALDGVIIQADTIKFTTAPYKPPDRRYLKAIFRTPRVKIIDEETEYSDTALEPVRGMPPLEFLSLEMENHDNEDHLKTMGGHKSYNEYRLGEKRPLDLSPLRETPIKELEICTGYNPISLETLVDVNPAVINNTPFGPEKIKKWITSKPFDKYFKLLENPKL
jgi:hypothetical protein